MKRSWAWWRFISIVLLDAGSTQFETLRWMESRYVMTFADDGVRLVPRR